MGGTPAPALPPAAVLAPKIGEWVETLINTFIQNPVLKEWAAQFSEWIYPGALAAGFEFQLRSRATIVKRLAGALQQAEATAGPELLNLCALALSDYFGAPVAGTQIGLRGGTTQRKQLAESMGDLTLQRLFGTYGNPGQTSPIQGIQNLRTLVTAQMGLALEGWLESNLGLGYISQELPNVGDLDDIVAQTLGLGRATSRALRSVIDGLIVRPTQRYYRKHFLDHEPSESQLNHFLQRELISETEYFERMAELGWSHDLAAELKVMHQRLPSASELGRALRGGHMSRPDIEQLLQLQGYPEWHASMTADLLMRERRLDWQEASLRVARDMYRDREVDATEFRQLATVMGVRDDELQMLVALGDLERSRPTRLPRSEVEKAYVHGHVDLDRLRAWYAAAGYAPDDADVLEALAVEERVAFERKEAARPPDRPLGAGKVLPRGVLEQSYYRGLIADADLEAGFVALGFKPPELGGMLQLASKRRAEFQAAVARREAPRRGITAASAGVEAAYIRGLITDAQLQAFYAAELVREQDIPLLLALRRAQRAEHQQQQQRAQEQALESGTQPRP